MKWPTKEDKEQGTDRQRYFASSDGEQRERCRGQDEDEPDISRENKMISLPKKSTVADSLMGVIRY